MDKSNTYKLTLWTTLTVFIRILVYALLIGVCLFLVAICAFGDYYQGNSKIIALIAVAGMAGVVMYRLGPIVLLSLQYYFNELGRKIIIDEKNNELIINTSEGSRKINNLNLQSIEYHSCRKISNTIINDFGFVKFKLFQEGELIITNLLVEENEIRRLFSHVESTYKCESRVGVRLASRSRER